MATDTDATAARLRDELSTEVGRYGEAMFRKGRNRNDMQPALSQRDLWAALDTLIQYHRFSRSGRGVGFGAAVVTRRWLSRHADGSVRVVRAVVCGE